MKIEFTAVPVTLDAAAGEDSPRTITGVAVPWDTVATVSDGTKVAFSRGAFDVSQKAPKLLENHDLTQLRGTVTELADAEEGLLFTAKFARTAAANDAVELVKAGAYDSVSIGAMPEKFIIDADGVMRVTRASIAEISLVAMPAFRDAVITEIAASEPDADESPTEDNPEEEIVSEEITPVEAAAPATVPTAPLVAAAARPFVMPSASEYIGKMLAGGAEFAEFNARLRAAAPDVTTNDSIGILPDPIVGSVYNNFRGLRPVIDACGVRALPQGGKQFRRPFVQTHATIGASNGENVALDAGQFIIDEEVVTKGVYGGYVKLSEEDMDWTQPEVLGLLLDDMARIYANETDNVAADALASGSTNTINFDDANYDDPATWADWVYAAASSILSSSNGNLPTHIFLDPLMWRRLGRLSDTSKRPLFPEVGPMNAFGSASPSTTAANAFGLTVVVDRNFAANTLIVGDPSGFEIYEQQKGALSVEAADGSLSRYIKFRGYFATLMLDASKFVKAAIV